MLRHIYSDHKPKAFQDGMKWNYIFNVISFIPSWNVFVSKENKCSVGEWKQSGISCKLNLITSLEADLIIDSKNINTSFSLIRAVSSSKSSQEAQMNRFSTQALKVPLSLFHELEHIWVADFAPFSKGPQHSISGKKF